MESRLWPHQSLLKISLVLWGMLDERGQQITEVVCHDIISNHVNYWWNVWKMLISVSRPRWQKYHRSHLEITEDFEASGFKTGATCLHVAAGAATSAGGHQNDWSVPQLQVWGGSIFHHYSFITQRLLQPARSDGRNTRWQMMPSAPNNRGLQRNQVRCLRLWLAEGPQSHSDIHLLQNNIQLSLDFIYISTTVNVSVVW